MSYIKSYIRHIRGASDDTKNIHSFFLAGLMTGIFIVIYLYLVRGIAPPTPDMSGAEVRVKAEESLTPMDKILLDNQRVTSSQDGFEPVSAIRDAIRSAGANIDNIKNEFGEMNSVTDKITNSGSSSGLSASTATATVSDTAASTTLEMGKVSD